MTSIGNRLAVLLVIGAITSAIALGQTTRKDVIFAKAVTVNGTLVKSGTYQVRFDNETKQLTILRGKKVVATAAARIEKAESRHNLYVTRAESGGQTGPEVLVSVALKDGNQAVIENGGGNTETGMQQ